MRRIISVGVALAALAVWVAGSGCATMRDMAPMAASNAAGAERDTAAADRMLIWRAWLSMEVPSVTGAVARVGDIARQAGGYIESKSDSGEQRAEVTLRVPADTLKATMANLEALGRVTSRHLASEDVTEQYVDTDARLKTMVALRDRLRALLDKAQDVKDILAIEKELGRVQANIDAMEARLKALKGKVDLASIRVSMKRPRVLGPLGYLVKGAWWTIEKLFVIRE